VGKIARHGDRFAQSRAGQFCPRSRTAKSNRVGNAR
jgi:hypothetical protein